MGYNADQTRSTGVFFLSTSGSSPYCGKYIVKKLVLVDFLSTGTQLYTFFKITLCVLMDFPIHIATMSMGLPIVYFKGSQEDFS